MSKGSGKGSGVSRSDRRRNARRERLRSLLPRERSERARDEVPQVRAGLPGRLGRHRERRIGDAGKVLAETHELPRWASSGGSIQYMPAS
jgi:hypothetical protein